MPKKILVIDDEKDIAELIKMRLETKGYEVITASDGDTGLEMAKIVKPGLIVLDVMMPRMDGLTFVKKLKLEKSIKNTPIIVLTCKEKMQDLFEMEGVKEYMVKPYDPNELLEKIRKYLK